MLLVGVYRFFAHIKSLSENLGPWIFPWEEPVCIETYRLMTHQLVHGILYAFLIMPFHSGSCLRFIISTYMEATRFMCLQQRVFFTPNFKTMSIWLLVPFWFVLY